MLVVELESFLQLTELNIKANPPCFKCVRARARAYDAINICGVVYWQHNSPERFQKYFEETMEKFVATGKQICVLGDFNIDVFKGPELEL